MPRTKGAKMQNEEYPSQHPIMIIQNGSQTSPVILFGPQTPAPEAHA